MPSWTSSLSFQGALAILVAILLFVLFASAAAAGGWLGMQIEAVPHELARRHGLPPGVGVYVVDVLPDGPAHRAGIEAGDVVVLIDGEVQYSPALLVQSRAGSLTPHATVLVELYRGDDALALVAQVAEAPSALPPLALSPALDPAPPQRRMASRQD